MAINQELNKILKEMWRLDEKMFANEVLNEKEKEFYSEHLEDIKEYYKTNSKYWNEKDISI